MINKQVKIPSTNIGKGLFRNMKVNKMKFGTTHLGEIKLKNINADASIGTTTVKDVKMSLNLRFSIDLCVKINLIIKTFKKCVTLNLGTLHIPNVPVGDMKVNMNNVGMLIDEVSVDPLNVNVNPVRDVQADRLRARKMRLDNLDVPRDPFSLEGMDIDSMALKGMDVPAVYANFLKVDEISELNITIPEVTLPEINLSAHTGKIISTQDLKTDAIISRKSIGTGWGWGSVDLNVDPTVHMTIGKLEVNGVRISTKVRSTEIKNITVPINVFDIGMGDLNIENINVPELNLGTI